MMTLSIYTLCLSAVCVVIAMNHFIAANIDAAYLGTEAPAAREAMASSKSWWLAAVFLAVAGGLGLMGSMM